MAFRIPSRKTSQAWQPWSTRRCADIALLYQGVASRMYGFASVAAKEAEKDGHAVRGPSLAATEREHLLCNGSERAVGNIPAEVGLGAVSPRRVGIMLAPKRQGQARAARGRRSGGPLQQR